MPGLGALAAHWASEVHGSHLLETQMGLVAAVQSELVLHSTQGPAGAQTGLAGSFVAQALASALAQATQVLLTQKGRFGSPVHWASAVHSTHLPLPASQTPVGDLHAVGPAA